VGTYVDTTSDQVLYWDAESAGRWGVAKTLGTAPAGASSPVALTVDAVSCVGSGSCAVAGSYASRASGADLIFVATQRSGRWSAVMHLPGIAALDSGNQELVSALRCVGAAGSCLLAGTYVTVTGDSSIFTASSAGSVWHAAATLKEPKDASSQAFAAVGAVSCPSAGHCTLVGTYAARSGDFQVLVANESAGVWPTPSALTGIDALNRYYAQGTAVSCSSNATCEIGGIYSDSSGATQGFVARETRGSVTAAAAIPGLAALNAGGGAAVDAVACTAPGSCVLGGSYTSRGSNQDAFVETVTSGTAMPAKTLPGWRALNHDNGIASGAVVAAACSRSSCAIAGTYTDSKGNTQVFGDSESSGTWRTVAAVAGAPLTAVAGDSAVLALTCDAVLACDVAASGTASRGGPETYEVDGSPTSWTWAHLYAPSASVRLTANAGGNGLTCWGKGSCAAVGYFEASASSQLGWIDFEAHGVWGTAKAIMLSTADKSVVPTSVGCVSGASCVVTFQVAATVADAQNFNYIPEVAIDSAGKWGALSAIKIKNATYPVVTPNYASAVCSAGSCHVLAVASLAKSRTGSQYGQEAAVADVVGGKLSAYSGLDVNLSTQGDVFPEVLTCTSSSQCIEVDLAFNYTASGNTAFSVVHRLAAGKWTTVAKLTGPVRKEGSGGNTFSLSENEVTSASCTTSGACELVGSVSETKGPVTISYATSLTGSTFAKRVTLAGYRTAATSSNFALSVHCLGASCVVVGESFVSGLSEEVVISSITGSTTGAISKATISNNSQVGSVACAGVRSCMLTVETYGASGPVVDELLLEGSTLTLPTPLPGAAAHATSVIGPVAATGGAYAYLVDEGSTATRPIILQT